MEMLMKYVLWMGLLFCALASLAQSEASSLQFQLKMDGQALELGKSYELPGKEGTLAVETVRLYLSHLQFFQDDEWVADLPQQHLLLDAEKPTSLQVEIPLQAVGKFNQLRFQLGVDSLTNMAGAQGGDLDPMYGMYWAWQSGYINLKLEGTASASPARHKRFQFHLGGFLAPFPSVQEIRLPTTDTDQLLVAIQLDQFFAAIDLAQTYQVMSPGEQAASLSRVFASIFSLLP